jgi:UPF0755 protein
VPAPRHQRRRRSALARVAYSLFIAFALAGIAVFGLGAYGYSKYVAPGPLQANKIYQIDKGLGAPEIGEALAKEGIVSDGNLFAAAALLTGKRGRLKAGEYEFPQQASIEDVLNIIASGKAIAYKLSIPEGWTTAQILERVNANEILTGEITVTPAEGALLPDTYVFKRGKSRDEVVSDMMQHQAKLIDELWRTRAPELPIASKEEAVTLASIVEKETGVAEERPLIAGVFINRLKKQMRLQSDPTIIYGITMGKAKLDRALTRKDIDTKTDYNTYQIDGLPPAPIANPGRAALEAVLNPATTQALYFVADGSGGHAFATTLDEHKANVVKWREIEKNRGQVEVATAETAPADPATTAPDPNAPPAEAQPSTTTILLPDVAELPEEVAPSGEPAPPAPADAATPVPAPDDAAAKPADPAAPEAKTVETAPNATATAEVPPATPEAKPAETAAGDQPPLPEPKPFAEPNPPPAAAEVPIPQEKPVQTAAIAAETETPQAKPLKPGTVVKVAKRLVPIPVPKPKQ